MARANREQIDFWTGNQGQKWLRLQPDIDRMMAPHLEAGLHALGEIGGHHCLDVGCGAGTSSMVLAEKVGATGSVTGIDVSTPLLCKAKERAAERGNMCFIEADAQDHPFLPETFDILFSRFGIMFFQDPAIALGNLRHGCRQGAKLTAITWREPRENPWVMLPVTTAREFVTLPSRPAPDAPGQFQWADPDRVRGWLEESGWSAISVDPLDITLTFHAAPAEVSHFLLQMGPASQLIADAGGDLKERAEARLTDTLLIHYQNGAVHLESACWAVTAAN
ncbi:MAG: class I SAM-dependent methyltransferase [Rhodospirillaceae bacterium]|nr:class I SAM-dependent methyltransferase [Rhodospirillaceae bacterium]